MSREYKSKDKGYHKMTRDSIFERNTATSEQEHISGRNEDFSLRQDNLYKQETPLIWQLKDVDIFPKRSIRSQKQVYKRREAITPPLPASSIFMPKPDCMDKLKQVKPDNQVGHISRLTYSRNKFQYIADDSAQDKKLSKLKKNAEKANMQLENACKNLSEQHHIKAKLHSTMPVSFAKKGTDSVKLVGTSKIRQKIYEVEHENVGVEAAHRSEQVAEATYYGGKRVNHAAYQFKKNRPQRTVLKLGKKARRANIRYDYRKVLIDNPKIKSNTLSRYMQKRKIKKQYAGVARKSRYMFKGGGMAANAQRIITGVIRKRPITLGVVLISLMLILFMYSLLNLFGSLSGGVFSAVFASSYLAKESEIDKAELFYTEWETDLQIKIRQIEREYPGYDEYRYQVDNIAHSAYELIAFLTAVYGDFEYENIRAVLQEIWSEQYRLSFVPSVETRYIENDGGERIPINLQVLTITLTSRSFTDIIFARMDDEQHEIFSLLMQTKGNRQFVGSPFNFNWLPRTTSYYGYRIHPTTDTKDYHKGIDIGVPIGTDIHAGYDGIVAYAGYNGNYGYVVVIDDGNGLIAKYAHCDTLMVNAGQEVKADDIIAKSGNTGNSTGPHLHFEIIKDEQYLNPLYFAITNDDGVIPIYSNPVEWMGDGSYAALITEAERWLGMPYVWGGSSPSTSFDCSGFVSWVLNQSGVASVGRQTAQGLYNLCAPVQSNNPLPGDLIFFTGTYSSANPVTHVGIYVGNGMMIHCGNPIQYTSINSNYWKKHFYAFGRIN